MNELHLAIIILSFVVAVSATIMVALWYSLKKAYAQHNHIVPLNMRLGLFGIGCCTLVAPFYVIIHLLTILYA